MCLASGIAIEAYYKNCSIALDIGLLNDNSEIEDLMAIMKTLGYKIKLNLISSEEDNVKQQIAAMSEQEHWQCCIKNDLNRDFIFYLFEDLTELRFDKNIKKPLDNRLIAQHNKDNLAVPKKTENSHKNSE